jgi:hypothetical protein
MEGRKEGRKKTCHAVVESKRFKHSLSNPFLKEMKEMKEGSEGRKEGRKRGKSGRK